MDSILTSIKKLLGITEDYTEFDTDLIIHINSVLSALVQIGIGPKSGYSIVGSSNTWSEFVDDPLVECVKSYVYLRVKLLFDPPLNSFIVNSMNEQIAEFEFRMHTTMEDANNTSNLEGKEENQNGNL